MSFTSAFDFPPPIADEGQLDLQPTNASTEVEDLSTVFANLSTSPLSRAAVPSLTTSFPPASSFASPSLVLPGPAFVPTMDPFLLDLGVPPCLAPFFADASVPFFADSSVPSFAAYSAAASGTSFAPSASSSSAPPPRISKFASSYAEVTPRAPLEQQLEEHQRWLERQFGKDQPRSAPSSGSRAGSGSGSQGPAQTPRPRALGSAARPGGLERPSRAERRRLLRRAAAPRVWVDRLGRRRAVQYQRVMINGRMETLEMEHGDSETLRRERRSIYPY